jgi:hypothetical protein
VRSRGLPDGRSILPPPQSALKWERSDESKRWLLRRLDSSANAEKATLNPAIVPSHMKAYLKRRNAAKPRHNFYEQAKAEGK